MLTIDRETTAEIAISILEATVFADCETADSLPECKAEEFFVAEIAYSGTRNGDVLIVASKAQCGEWADLLMVGEDEDAWCDVLGEIANIVAGNWLSHAFAPSEKIRLNPPSVAILGDEQWASLVESDDTIVLSVEGSPFLLQINPRD